MKHNISVIVGTGLSGFIVLAVAIALGWYGFPALIAHEIKHGVLLVNGTEAYERWRKFPLAIQFKVYLFNVTNPEEVQNGANPVVREVGPYVYDQYREKFNITDEGDYTLSYVQNLTFYFNKDKSGNLSEDDVVTVLNTMIMGTALNVRRNFGPDLSMDPFLKEISPVSESIFLTVTVRKLFWDGVTIINCTGDKLSSDAEMICGVLTPHLPVMVSEHEPGIFKMAYFRHKNASSNGRVRVNTGISDSRALARIEEWNGQPNLMTWSGEYCNSINGTDSTIFPPFWSPKDTVAIFEVELCRSLYAEFDSELTWKGVPVFRYIGSLHNFEDTQDFPPNICFCEQTNDEPPICLKSGVLDLYSCLGVSMIMSLPHLYNASPDYHMYVQGLNPDKKKHETVIDMEPETGIPLRGFKRLQMNMFLTRMDSLKALNNVSEGLFPVFWMEEGAEIDDRNLAKIQRLYTVIRIFAVLKWLLIAAGVLLLCVSVYFCVFKRNSDTKITHMEDKNEVVIAYDNKTYVHEPEVKNDALSMTAISDIIRNEQISIKKRKSDRFPGKLNSGPEPNKTNENVGLGVSRDVNSRLTLSNVFM